MMSKPRAETVFVRGSDHRQRLITQNGETLRKSRPLVTSRPSMQTLLVNIMPVFAPNLLIAEVCKKFLESSCSSMWYIIVQIIHLQWFICNGLHVMTYRNISHIIMYDLSDDSS